MTYTRMILEACENVRENFTPQDIYELLLSRGISVKKGTVKRIINRLYHRKLLGRAYGQRGLYFFANRGDNYNHQCGQKGTEEGSCNHLKHNAYYSASPRRRGQKNEHKRSNHSRNGYVLKRTCAIFYNNPGRVYTIKELYRIFNDPDMYSKRTKYRTVQSAVYYLLRRGIIYRVPGEWGKYALEDEARALAFLEGGPTPMGTRNGTVPKFKLPALNLHGQRVDKVITIPETVWEHLKSMQSSVSPFFNKKPPNENDPGRQWVFETENVKWVVSERTLKAQIFPKGEDWLKELQEYMGAWVVQELKGARVTMHEAINKKEYEGYRAGVLEIVEDHSEWKEGEYEFHGPKDAVETAMGLSLTGLFTPQQSGVIADLLHTYNEKHDKRINELLDYINLFAEFTVNNLSRLSELINKQDKKMGSINSQIEALKKEVNDSLNTIAGGIRMLLNKPRVEINGGVEGYA